jgi:hypothetical protein
MLVIGKADEELGTHGTGHRHFDGANEISLDAKYAFEEFVDLALVCFIRVCKIVDGATAALG